MLELANIACYVFHTILIGFNMFGWIWRSTRFWHLLSMGLTSFSWFVMGAFYGWGYCLSTDWHFQVREELGRVDPETSFVQLLARRGLGITLSQSTSNILTVSVFVLILVAMAIVWGRDLYQRRKTPGKHGE